LKESQVSRWFSNRRSRIASNPQKQKALEKGKNSHGLKRVEVSVLMPMADIMLLSKKESPEIVDILDDSLEEEEDEVSLIEVSKISTTIDGCQENGSAAQGPVSWKKSAKIPTKHPSFSSTNVPSHSEMNSITGHSVENAEAATKTKLKNNSKFGVTKKPSKVSEKGSDLKRKECPIKGKVSMVDLQDVEPNSKVEDLVEGLLKNIETLENELVAKDADLINTKKDLETVQKTLENKEKVLNTVQESIPKVISEHKNALQTKDDEISALKLQTSELVKEFESKQKGPKVEDNKKSIQAKEDEIFVLKSKYSRLLEKFEASEGVKERYEEEMSNLKSRNAKLQQELDCKTRNNSNTSVEVLELKESLERLENLKKDLELNLTNQLNESQVEAAHLKASNSKLRKEIDEKSELHIVQLKKHEDERADMQILIAKCEDRIALLKDDLGKREDEVKILKYKEKQASSNATTVEETKKLLEENRKDTLALKEYERKLTKKITSLELDLFTKTAESETQTLVISKLNERIQSLQQKNVDTPKVDGHGDVDIYNKPELSNIDNETTFAQKEEKNIAIEDLVNEDNESLIKGVPQTSPYVVSSSKKKRKRSNSDSATEEDISNIKASVEEPEFESLCAEIETLCVPTPNRPVPVFLTSGDRKKIKMSEDHVEDNLPTDESLESYDVARSVIYDLLHNIM